MSGIDGPQDNPQNHDTVSDAGVDKPSQAEGDDAQVGGAESTAEDVTTAVDDDDLDAGVSEPTD
ncbi:hypothetical protein NB037_05095 [Rathayibacter sp. ZW T2_19]|uniref:Uncharacterized protein n=1 Tax=Rathayibacter rubneri TaxID=2950106 RepID=A0A9X2DZC2_9MICO|nr:MULTISPECIES: hypothetical protein [Rathayibacter]MBO0983489.1 hypothetical protein [Rathayibacter sp. SD072]MCM6761791.1 hypothetical protein [Rathayibacter rubneri]